MRETESERKGGGGGEGSEEGEEGERREEVREVCGQCEPCGGVSRARPRDKSHPSVIPGPD